MLRRHFFLTTVLATALLTLVAVFALPQPVDAVTIGPAKIEATADPGDTVTGKFFLKNEAEQAQTFYSSVQKFTEDGEGKSFVDTPTLLSQWITIPTQVALEAGGEERFDFSIDVPEDAPPGGHFGVIWWSTAPPDQDGQQVSITTRAGSLVYLNVTGDVTESAAIEAFNSANTVVGIPETNFSLSIRNNGTVYITPTGTITITSLLGNTRNELPINSENLQVLPGSTKKLSVSFSDEGWYWGPYQAKASVRYGNDGSQAKVLTEAAWFWVVPLTPTIIGLIFLLLLLVGGPIGLRRYNRWIAKRLRDSGEV